MIKVAFSGSGVDEEEEEEEFEELVEYPVEERSEDVEDEEVSEDSEKVSQAVRVKIRTGRRSVLFLFMVLSRFSKAQKGILVEIITQ